MSSRGIYLSRTCARILRDKLNDFLWVDKNHIFVSELIEWCQKYLYLPRLSSLM